MSAPRIVVTRPIPQPAIRMLREAGDVWVPTEDRPLTVPELAAAVPGAEAVVTMLHDRVDAAFLDAAGERLRVVANVAVGYDNIDVPACRHRGVLVTNTPDVLVDATADLTLALLLAVTRRVAEGDRLLRRREPWSWSMSFMLGTGLQGRRLGVVGFGRIGQAVARRAAAFGMDVVYASPRPVEGSAAVRVGLAELLRTSDVVSLHCPLTPDTRHLIDAGALDTMSADAFLINTARGPVVDEEALARALATGGIRGAALDVFEHEPRVHEALLGLDNVVLTPHLGSATTQTREAMADLAVRNVIDVLAGRPARTPVRPAGDHERPRPA